MTYNDVENGVNIYINQELCKKVDDWRKWALPLVVSLLSPNIKKKYESNIEFLRNAGIVDDHDDINIDFVYEKLYKVAKDNDRIVCNIPMLGAVTFTSSDVEMLYKCIQRSSMSNNTSPLTTTSGVDIGSIFGTKC